MRVKIVSLVLLLYNLNLQSQVIKLDEFYIGKGVIINDYDIIPFTTLRNSFQKKHSIHIDDAVEAEKFIMNGYYEHERRKSEHFGSNYNFEKFKDPKKVKRKFKRYYRQYAGYIDKYNDTIIYVGMLNFSSIRKAKSYFNGWEDTLSAGAGDWYYANQAVFIYNKSKRRLEDDF